MKILNHHRTLLILAILYVLIQCFTLSYQPLPWFDETYFASIAENFIRTGLLTPRVAVFEEVKIYGFVYFFCTGLSMKILGMSIWSFRIVNFCAGLGCLWIITQLSKNSITNSPFKNLLLISLIALDPFFNLSLHEGRMDLMALFFMLVAYNFIYKQNKYPSYQNYLYSGVCTTLACLTTPRVAVLGLGLIASVFLRTGFWKKSTLYALLGLGFSFWLLYSGWIMYAFGGYVPFVNYYLRPTFEVNSGAMAELFLGGNFYIPKQEYALICSGLVMLGIHIFRNPRILGDAWILISILNTGLFYVLVRDYGPYSIFILPFYYLLIFRVLCFERLGFKNPIVYILMGLFLHHAAYFTLKNLQTFASFSQRDYTTLDDFIQKHIPSQSRVVGEPMFFYAVRKTNSDFQYMDIFESLEAREVRQREKYKYQYLIVSDHLLWRKPEIVAYYLKQAKLRRIARLEIPISYLSQKINALGLLSNTERTGYNCTIYKHLP